LATLLETAAADREIVIISRRGFEDVALVAASELSSLLETAHLLRSPKNARRLLTALNRAKSRRLKPQSIEELRRRMGLDKR
jgi:antitoxin YefM